jgi:hypothetical protein
VIASIRVKTPRLSQLIGTGDLPERQLDYTNKYKIISIDTRYDRVVPSLKQEKNKERAGLSANKFRETDA